MVGVAVGVLGGMLPVPGLAAPVSGGVPEVGLGIEVVFAGSGVTFGILPGSGFGLALTLGSGTGVVFAVVGVGVPFGVPLVSGFGVLSLGLGTGVDLTGVAVDFTVGVPPTLGMCEDDGVEGEGVFSGVFIAPPGPEVLFAAWTGEVMVTFPNSLSQVSSSLVKTGGSSTVTEVKSGSFARGFAVTSAPVEVGVFTSATVVLWLPVGVGVFVATPHLFAGVTTFFAVGPDG